MNCGQANGPLIPCGVCIREGDLPTACCAVMWITAELGTEMQVACGWHPHDLQQISASNKKALIEGLGRSLRKTFGKGRAT
jgi:hypothetical protein